MEEIAVSDLVVMAGNYLIVIAIILGVGGVAAYLDQRAKKNAKGEEATRKNKRKRGKKR